MDILCCILIGYLIGTINPAYIISRLRGFDIRKKGSGNAGASNAIIVLGKLVGVFCALFDIAKCSFAVWLTPVLFPNFNYAFVLTGVCCILGHIFPFYMRFRGGKGLACLGGMILMYDWRVFLILLGSEAVFLFLVKYLCFVPMTAAVAFSVIYGVMEHDLIGALMLAAVAVVICFKHRSNIKRILAGSEARISYLWNKKKETERLRTNTGLSEKDFF